MGKVHCVMTEVLITLIFEIDQQPEHLVRKCAHNEHQCDDCETKQNFPISFDSALESDGLCIANPWWVGRFVVGWLKVLLQEGDAINSYNMDDESGVKTGFN